MKPISETKYRSLYSGPGKTGICKCGHSWDDHHLGIVMNKEYFQQTGEEYVPQECEYYGCNELGGMMPNPKDPKGEWICHCGKYEDAGKVKSKQHRSENKKEKI
jgi:hypothetical protein